jgi:hypothetical protein
MSELNKLIEKQVTKILDEYSNDLADVINEAIDIKLSKMLLKENTKLSLRDQILERAGKEETNPNILSEIAFGNRGGNNEQMMNRLKAEQNTGIYEDYTGKKASAPNDKIYETNKNLNEVSGNLNDYRGNKDAMIDDLANADYSELID